MKLVMKYREICTVKVQTGDTALFWSDKWLGNLLQLTYPRLFSYALDSNISVKDVFDSVDRILLFSRPLSQQAYDEFMHMQQAISQFSLNPQGKDQWVTIWKDGIYTSSRYYHHCFKDVTASMIYSYIWKSKVQLKLKVFAWLLVSDRLNTRDMLRRRKWNVTDVFHCELCPTRVTEDWVHLFFQCNFSIRVWNYLQIYWEPGDGFEQVFIRAGRAFNKPFFTDIVILAAWHIWKQRNEAIFQNVLPSFRSWRRNFIHDATMHEHRVWSKHAHNWSEWISSLS